MNQLMYYGGFALAIALFILTILFFILFKVPSIHRYFRYNNRKGLVEAEVISGDLKKKPAVSEHMTRKENDNLTEIITLTDIKTEYTDPQCTDYLNTEQTDSKLTESTQKFIEQNTGTENFNKTELL